MIFFFFKPMNLKQQEFVDIPLFELQTFTMYELNAFGLQTYMTGDNATRYSDKYVVKNMNYTDNSKRFIANIKANEGLYKNNIVDLHGDVMYAREDGLIFESQDVVYDKNTSIVTSPTPYTGNIGENNIIGSSLIYNNILNKIESKNVLVTYKLKKEQL